VDFALGFFIALAVSGWTVVIIINHTVVPEFYRSLRALKERLEPACKPGPQPVFEAHEDNGDDPIIPLPENTEPPEA
jgi:hypothetical protein